MLVHLSTLAEATGAFTPYSRMVRVGDWYTVQ